MEILRAANRIRASATEVVQGYGLTLQQYNVLRILRGAGEPLPTMEIRRRMLERAPGVTRIIDAIERMDLIQRWSVPEDRRSTACEITDHGLSLLRQIDPAMEKWNRDLMEDFNDSEAAAMGNLVKRVK